MSLENNKKIAEIFRNMSSIYKYLGGENRFRAIAYGKGAKVIDAQQEDIAAYKTNHLLKEHSGIGESMKEKIGEFLKTGKIEKYEELKRIVPHELLDIMSIRGFGPQTLKRLHDELNISTKNEIIEALKDGSISMIKGFGQKKINNLILGLKLHKTIEGRMLLWNALEVGDKIVERIRLFPQVKQIALAGSCRRRKETIGDIDILIACEEKHRDEIISFVSSHEFAQKILAKGDTKVSIILKGVDKQIDFRIVNEDEWATALQYFTGSKEHTIHLRSIAKENGYKLSEYSLTAIKNGVKINVKTEEDLYRTLNFQYIPAELREDNGEFESAFLRKIPELISLEDIKGDMHVHSNWSDGTNTIDEIVNHLRKEFSYEYIVMSDHSKASSIANGMDEKQILKQISFIKELNRKRGDSFVKTGIEVDILPDGSLDISDEILSQLDWVTASIHSNFKKDNTQRLVRAFENPYVSCIAHPTGRLIGLREPYQLDFQTILNVAKDTHTALEINAQPQRMDLNDDFASLAMEKGISLVINTDSHSLNDLKHMKLGVYIARRAWCQKSNILNTKSWRDILLFKNQKRKMNSKTF